MFSAEDGPSDTNLRRVIRQGGDGAREHPSTSSHSVALSTSHMVTPSPTQRSPNEQPAFSLHASDDWSSHFATP